MHHLGEEVHGQRVLFKVLALSHQVLIAVDFPFGEGGFHFRQGIRVLPQLVGGSSQTLENLEDLTDLAFPIE
jgi:hypothetical protein